MTDQRLAVLRGRFAPPTLPELAMIEDALAEADRVVVLVSASEQAPSCRMPWTSAARVEMVQGALAPFAGRVVVRPVPDWRYDPGERHAAEAAAVAGLGRVIKRPPDLPDQPELIAALFERGVDALKGQVPDTVLAAVTAFSATETFAGLAEEYAYVRAYHRAWAVAPYPPVLVTADTVIVHVPDGGEPHLLLIRRGGLPGRGNWALPGGFVDPGEWLIDAAFRELREETGLTLSDAEAEAALKGRAVFDAPDRSSRGRAITHGFYFVVEGGALPDVAGDDDAAEARWWPVNQVHTLYERLLEDHPDIIMHFLGPLFRP
jgi:bifunctional NMN adenylyltransferase/nudix hydrolase